MMRRNLISAARALAMCALACAVAAAQAGGRDGANSPNDAQPPDYPAPVEGDYVMRDFRFRSGETLPELKLHYTTVGTPVRDSAGVVRNAVLVMHGTGGTGRAFLRPQFAGVLFRRGGLLDATRYFIVLPDGIGHGGLSQPSDGPHARLSPFGEPGKGGGADPMLLGKIRGQQPRALVGDPDGGGAEAGGAGGRDPRGFCGAEGAAGDSARRDRGPEPYDAPHDYRLDPQRSGVAGRRVQARAARPHLGHLHAHLHGQQSTSVAEAGTDASGGRQTLRRDGRQLPEAVRRQRYALPVRRLARLRPGPRSRKDQSAARRRQLGGRSGQPAGTRRHGARDQASPARTLRSHTHEPRNARPRHALAPRRLAATLEKAARPARPGRVLPRTIFYSPRPKLARD